MESKKTVEQTKQEKIDNMHRAMDENERRGKEVNPDEIIRLLDKRRKESWNQSLEQ